MTRLSRRRLLLAAAAVSVTQVVQARDPLRVIIRSSGADFTYDENDADDLGAFSSPAGFTQSSSRAVHAGFPLTVHFRRDRESDRMEVVFELGKIWDGRAANLASYRAEVWRGESLISAVEVPRHFWFSRWRWQSAPRPVYARMDDLRQRGLLPPLARRSESLFTRAAPAPGNASYAVMELAGIAAQMGAGGERPDLGLMTEHQARFLCTKAGDALATLRAQAEAAGTLPWHIRDERTGAPVNLDDHENMSWYGDANVGDPHIPHSDSGISIDAAHQPALAYVPYLLTGDPYHLEDLQFAANYNRGSLPPADRLSIPQPRAFAWSLRTLAQAARVTPERVPSWLLPAAYFRKDLDRTRQWFAATYIEDSDPLRRIFRATDNLAYSRDEPPQAPQGSWVAPWQHDFLAAVLGWTVLMGFENWREAFHWQLGGTLARTSGRSGWRRAYPSPYRLIVRERKSAPVAASWEEAWRLSSTMAGWPEADELPEGDPTYAIYARGVLAIAARLGVTEAQEPLAWITEQLRRRNAVVPYKWRFG